MTTTTPTDFTTLTREDIAKGWEGAKRDEAAAEKVKKAAAGVRGMYAHEADRRMNTGDVVTVDGNRRVSWSVSEYEVEKAGEILKALIPFLTQEQLDLLATIRTSAPMRTGVRKLGFKAFKD